MTASATVVPHGPAPAGWYLVTEGEDGQAWRNLLHALTLIWSVTVEEDGRPWLHLSVAGASRLPRWGDLVAAKDWIAGPDAYAYQVVPPRALHVNIHPYALHLFVPLFAPAPLPEFTRGLGTL